MSPKDDTEIINDGEDTTIDRLLATLKGEELPDDPTYTKAVKSLNIISEGKISDEATD